MKATTFIIAMLMIGVVMTTVSLMIVDLSSEYGTVYDNETLEVFSDTSDLKALTVTLDEQSSNQTTNSGILDIVGNFISRAVSVLKTSKQSVTTFNNMATSGTEKIGLPSYFLDAILASITVMFILGVIVSAMIKKDI
jgi:hypothetical protein